MHVDRVRIPPDAVSAASGLGDNFLIFLAGRRAIARLGGVPLLRHLVEDAQARAEANGERPPTREEYLELALLCHPDRDPAQVIEFSPAEAAPTPPARPLPPSPAAPERQGAQTPTPAAAGPPVARGKSHGGTVEVRRVKATSGPAEWFDAPDWESYLPAGFRVEDYLPATMPNLGKWSEAAGRFVAMLCIHRQVRPGMPYARLPSAFLRERLGVHRHREILEALMRAGVVRSSKGQRGEDYFVAGRHRGYCVVPPFTGPWLPGLARFWTPPKEPADPAHLKLFRHLHEVTIDMDHVAKVREANGIADADDALRISEGAFYFKVGKASHRVFTNVSGLRKSYRPALRGAGGSPLVELDVAGSQPLLLAGVYMTAGDAKGIREAEERVNLIQERSQGREPPSYVAHGAPASPYVAHGLPRDWQEYKSLCERGRIYERMRRLVGEGWEKVHLLKRVLFADNCNVDSGAYRAFSAYFPSVLAFIRRMKQGDFAELSRFLQRVESHIITREVAGSLGWCLTVHDSVLVPPSEESAAREAIRRGYGKLGVLPTVRVKAPTSNIRAEQAA